MEKYKISEDLPEKNEYGVYGLDIGTDKIENQITIWIGGGKKHPSNEEEEQAKLIVDCLNTYECEKLKPSELKEQRDELLEALNSFVEYCYGTELQYTERFKKGVEVMEKVLKQKQ